jgi:hypothetical protein
LSPRKIALFLFVLFFSQSICAQGISDPNFYNELDGQWFTGTVLAPTPITMDPAHPSLETAVLFSRAYGFYNNDWKLQRLPSLWTVLGYIDFQVGFNSFLGAELITAAGPSWSQGAHSTGFQDTIIRFGFQISLDKDDSWIPDFRILLQEIFPTGKYQKFNPKKKGTDETGEGSFQTGIQFAFQKAFRKQHKHWFRFRGSVGYFIPANVHVKGVNAYGGGKGTNGTIRPGNFIPIYFAGEYCLSKRWALAFDSFSEIGFKGSRFSGTKGFLEPTIPATVEAPAHVQISFAPEIQHTFNANTGMIVGAWFSLAGRNSVAFSGIFISILHSF